MRIINGSAATAYWIDTGVAQARLVAVDGHDIQPVTGQRFGLAMGQRLDIEVDLPGTGAFPILALREGARERTGLILATAGADVPRLGPLADAAAPLSTPIWHRNPPFAPSRLWPRLPMPGLKC